MLLLVAVLGAPAAAGDASSAVPASTAATATRAPVGQPTSPRTVEVPATFTDPTLDLRDGPVSTPIELELPSLGARAAVLGVGITSADVMDAPMGPAGDPVWQQAFWYRGSSIPGANSTALIAGHVDDPLGRPGVFASLDRLEVGDLVVVHDTRSGLDVRFAVTEVATYSLEDASDPAILARIYGEGPVAGTAPRRSADGSSHLSLITCAGTFRNGTHDHRLVVYAARIA